MTFGYTSLISQNTSWSRLNISLESFQNIVDAHEFSDNVYDVVRAFRRRTSETHQFRWSACRARLTKPGVDHFGQSVAYQPADYSLQLIDFAEICYRIQYPVRNNRNRGDPFSMRQMGVCQKSCGPQSSTWIILQPSPEILSKLELVANNAEYADANEDDPMSLHIVFFSFQRANWDDFLEHLRTELEPLVCLP